MGLVDQWSMNWWTKHCISSLPKVWKFRKDVSNSSLTSHWKSGNQFSRLWVLYSFADSSPVFSQPRMSLVIGRQARHVLLICWNNKELHWLEWSWKCRPIRRGVIPNNLLLKFGLSSSVGSIIVFWFYLFHIKLLNIMSWGNQDLMSSWYFARRLFKRGEINYRAWAKH